MEERSRSLNTQDTMSPEVESATATVGESMNEGVIEHQDDIYRSEKRFSLNQKNRL
jgi:hypothetical protein